MLLRIVSKRGLPLLPPTTYTLLSVIVNDGRIYMFRHYLLSICIANQIEFFFGFKTRYLHHSLFH